MSAKKSRIEKSTEAFSTVVKAISRDMPLVMHGSGDVQPSQIDPDSVQLLSELTASYIANLVEAAVDAHEILNGGPTSLPPPPLPKTRKTTIPSPYVTPPDPKEKSTTPASKVPEKPFRKRRRTTDEFWDEPLPEPKIKNKPNKVTESQGPKFEGVSVDEWVGVSGVDFFERHRARNAHVSMPAAIGTQSFIFPVCHDIGLYGKVRGVQAARRDIAPLLVDPVIQEVIQNESNLQGSGAPRKRDKKRGKEDEDLEPEDSDSDPVEAKGAAWPGLESLLPVHMTGDFRQFM